MVASQSLREYIHIKHGTVLNRATPGFHQLKRPYSSYTSCFQTSQSIVEVLPPRSYYYASPWRVASAPKKRPYESGCFHGRNNRKQSYGSRASVLFTLLTTAEFSSHSVSRPFSTLTFSWFPLTRINFLFGVCWEPTFQFLTTDFQHELTLGAGTGTSMVLWSEMQQYGSFTVTRD